MLKKLLQPTILLSPDEGGGGGGGNEEGGEGSGADITGGEGEGGGEGDGDDEGDDGKTAKPTGLSRDDITDILSRVIPAAAADATRPEPERQYTQAEIEQMMNVWKPDDGFLRKLGFENPTAAQLQAVHELRDALIKQANTMSEARMQQLMQKFESRITELDSYVSEQRAAAVMNSFYEKNPELKPYEEIVDAVSAKLEASGFKAPTQAKVFEEIAKSTNEVLKRMNIKVEKPKGGAGNGASGARGGNRMANLSGGGGQTGGGKGGQGQRKEGMAIFDDND